MGAHVTGLDEEAKETRDRREILLEAIEKLRAKEKDKDEEENEEQEEKKNAYDDDEYDMVETILKKFLVVSESAFLDTVDL